MEYLDNNVVLQAATKEQVSYALMEKQLIEANKKIADLESELEWSVRSYE